MRRLTYLTSSFSLVGLLACGDDGGSGTSGDSDGSSATMGTETSGTESAGTDSTSATTQSSATDSGSDSTASAGSQSSGESQTSGETSAGTDSGATSGSTGGSAGPLLEADGTFGGEAFSLSCDFSDIQFSNLQCDSGRWFATCRPDPMNVGAIEMFQLWFVLSVDDATAGEKDLLGSQFGISMGDATAAVPPLSPMSPNGATNTITVAADTEALGPVSGSFEASWNDAGGQFGSVSGTFSFVCE